ncbi:MAG: hypothetical protein ACJ72H_17210 [Candidatus Sulfotelmatobacter sp.]
MLLCAKTQAFSLCILTLCGVSGRAAQNPRTAPGPAAEAFRDSVDAPPASWKGPRFKLSHAYPRQMPVCAAPWLKRKVSFNDPNPNWDDWRGYVQDIIDYVKEGQDPNLADDTGWRSQVNGETRWFHVPWMAYDGQRGREFAHGLTNELSTALSTLHEGRGSGKERIFKALRANSDVDPLFETWSVGMYNPCGGWSLGQVFPASGAPAVHTEGRRMFADGLPFPEGTVVMKILNTTAAAASVPYLRGSTDWQADAHVQYAPDEYSTCERRPRKLHLIQIDLAVVDARSPTRWVYSTLVYNGFLPGKSVLDRVEPLGIQWGSDPHTFPAVARVDSHPLHETVLAPNSQKEVPQHYGCEKRLAGAVDQANSSCVSCHMGAYAAPPPYLNLQGVTIPAIFNFPGICTDHNAANAAYFSDYEYPQPYPSSGGSESDPFAQAIPLDSSLQLAVAFAQYAVYVSPRALPVACPDPRFTKTARK